MATTTVGNPAGLIKPGNVEVFDRPIVPNPAAGPGGYSTTLSMSIGTDKGEVLIPTVYDGQIHTAAEAIAHYNATGENLGTFDTPANADAYATDLHNAQEQYVEQQQTQKDNQAASVVGGQDSLLLAVCKITIGGMDVTSKVRPYLISLEVDDKFDETAGSTCSIELDDSYGQLPVPADSAPISIEMGWSGGVIAPVFEGLVAEVESGCARKGGGRRLWVDGTGGNMLDKGKQRSMLSMGEGYPPDGQGQDVPL